MSDAHPGFILAPPSQSCVPVKGTNLKFPVNRIFCVGRNYEAHAKEMGMTVDRATPFYFTKSSSTIVLSGATVPYPPGTDSYHHEIELVVAIGKPAFCIAEEDALEIVLGYACGLDMTRRDLQLTARDKGLPWDLGKNFENAAVIAEIVEVSECGHIAAGDIRLTVNGEIRQQGDVSELIWNIPELIADLSKYYHLEPGDLIYSGTPAGIGPVVAGDQLAGSIANVGEITFNIAS